MLGATDVPLFGKDFHSAKEEPKGVIWEADCQVGVIITDPQDLIYLGDDQYEYKGMIGTVTREQRFHEEVDDAQKD